MALLKIVLIVLLGCLYEIHAAQDIYRTLDTYQGLRTFKSWAQSTQFLLSGGNALTVFAFNDSSYNSLPSDQKARFNIIASDPNLQERYVQTYTMLASLTLKELEMSKSRESVNGNEVFFATRSFRQWGAATSTGVRATYVNGARILGNQIECSNGKIYILDRPPDLPSEQKVYRWIMDDGMGSGVQTSRWQDLMKKLFQYHFTEAIAPVAMADRITYFLPSEQALSRIPSAELEALSVTELSNYFRMHFIPDEVLYTSFVNHQESARSGFENSQILFLRNDDKVVVKSGGVTASIIQGNITVGNGVIHVIDTMFGFVYNTLLKQIEQDCPVFGSYLQRIDPNFLTKVTQAKVNIFVPTDAAINRVRNMAGFDQNRTLVDFIVRLSMIKDGSVEVSQLNGNYDVRQHRISWYDDWRLVIYNDRNDTWVNGGHVRAKILKPDIKTTSGRMQIIDSVLGVPPMDVINTIYYDDYLLWLFWDLQSVGLDEYLEDPRFDKSSLPPRSFDRFGNTMYGQSGTGIGGGGMTTMNPYDPLYATQSPNQYPTSYPGQPTMNPNNIPSEVLQQRRQNQQQYPNNQNPNNQYPNNQYPNNQYPNNQYPNNQYPNNQYPNNQYPNNQYPNNQYPNNQYPNQNPYMGPSNQRSAYEKCGDFSNLCQFTFFAPNGSAVFNYKMSSYGRQISLRPNLYRYIMQRHMVLNRLIFLEQLPVSPRDMNLRTITGDTITLRKETDNIARVSWASRDRPGVIVSARVIMWDLGATNGVVHIIDNVLSSEPDLNVDPNLGVKSTMPYITLLFMCLVSMFCKSY